MFIQKEPMTCSKLYVTKSLQSQRTKDKIKTNFNIAVILCIHVSKNKI